MFFESWQSIGRLIATGTLAYIALLIMLRVSGARTLAKLNAFDLVVTVAIGSTLSSTVLPPTVTLADGVAALGLLIFLQYAVAWSSARSDRAERVVKNEPSLLLHRGRFLAEAMRRERVTTADVRAAIRGAGLGSEEEAEAVVLESSGDLHVIAKRPSGTRAVIDASWGPVVE